MRSVWGSTSQYTLMSLYLAVTRARSLAVASSVKKAPRWRGLAERVSILRENFRSSPTVVLGSEASSAGTPGTTTGSRSGFDIVEHPLQVEIYEITTDLVRN